MKRLLIPFLFISCSSYAAGIQKWTDEKGQVHYGDSPPTQTKTESIRISRPPSDPGKPLPRFTAKKADDENSSGAEKQPSVPETSEEQAKKQCEQAKKDLRVIKRSSRIRLKSDDGTVHYMSKEEIEQRRLQSEEDIKLFCN